MTYWILGIVAYLVIGYVLVKLALNYDIIEDSIFLIWVTFFVWPLMALIFGTIHGFVVVFDSDVWNNFSKWFWRIK